MKSKFAMVQMGAAADPAENLRKAERFVAEAMELCAPDLIVFPENCMSDAEGDIRTKNAWAQELDGPFVSGMQRLARENGVYIVFGMREKAEGTDNAKAANVDVDAAKDAEGDEDLRVYNTVVMLDDKGGVVSTYRKTHLYDAFGHKESDAVKAGDALFEPVETPFGKIGLFVCYEVRFPEVARDQRAKGAEIILMPTAWVKGDMKSLHFETLVRARAIENTVFLLACDQYSGTRMGESLAVDPMGVTLASGGEGEKVIPVFIDTDRIAEVRRKLPSYEDRRPELYF